MTRRIDVMIVPLRPLEWALATVLAVGIVGFCSGAAGAQTTQPSPMPGAIEPRADALLRQSCDALADARQVSFQANVLVDEVTETGQKLQYGKVITVAMRRPDRIAAQVKGDRQNYHFVYDGSTIYLLDPELHQYSIVRQAPGTIDAMLDFLAVRYGIATPLADLLFANPYESFCSRVLAGTYLGEHPVGSTPCHHLAFRNEAVDWQIWIDATAGAKPLPRKLVITYKQMPAQPQFIAVLDKWDLETAIADQTFQFTPPSDAKQVELPRASAAAGQP